MESLISAYDLDSLQENGSLLLNKIIQYLEGVNNDTISTLNYLSPHDLRSVFENTETTTHSEIISKILNYSLHLHHAHNLGHQVGVPTNLSILGNLLEGVINSSTAVYETSTVGNILDQIIIDRLLHRFGLIDGGGFFTSGGTLGNLTALLAARNQLQINLGDSYNHNRICILVSEHAHYCIKKAMKTMGFSNSSIVLIKTNEKLQLDMYDLEKKYHECIDLGYSIMAVVGSGCITVTGSYDDINVLTDFCHKYNIWLHIDAAHGGAVIFSEKYKILLKGIDRADSIVFDFHKMLGISACATAVLFKSYQGSYLAFNDDASYLFDQDNDDYKYDLGKRTYECTKPSRAISLYLMRNDCFFENMVDYTYGLSKDCANIIRQYSNFELFMEPMSNILCFRYSNDSLNIDLNQLNKGIRKYIIESGQFYIVQTTIDGVYRLRTTLMNPKTTTDDFYALLNMIDSIVSEKIIN